MRCTRARGCFRWQIALETKGKNHLKLTLASCFLQQPEWLAPLARRAIFVNA
jgi:hypothetical protein